MADLMKKHKTVAALALWSIFIVSQIIYDLIIVGFFDWIHRSLSEDAVDKALIASACIAELAWDAFTAFLVYLLIKTGWKMHRKLFRKPNSRKRILISGGVLLGLGYAMSLWSLTGLEGSWSYSSNTDLEQSLPLLIVSMISVCVYAPAAEELFFRLFMINTIKRELTAVPAVVIQAALFAVSHLSASWEGKVEIFVFGLIAGAAFVLSRCIYVPLAMHATNNLAAFAMENLSESLSKVFTPYLPALLYLGALLIFAFPVMLVVTSKAWRAGA
jgi:membrane protease YdiL (CAAX protease family)